MPDGEIILSKYKNCPVITAFIDNKMEFLSFDRDSQIHSIYLGKVDHIVKNINAAFIRYDKDNIGYLPMDKISNVCVTNRTFTDNDTLKNGDEIIVQIESEAIKTKKTCLTTAISLSGKYSVITLGRNGVGASVKLEDDTRKKLIDRTRPIFNAIVSEYESIIGNASYGLIIRTNAAELEDASFDAQISEDIRSTMDKFKSIVFEGNKRTIYSCIYKPESNVLDKAVSFLKNRKIDNYKTIEDSGIHGINSKIDNLRQNKIWLKSGAFLIIEQLESFNAIDVNSGKAIKGKDNNSLEINIEAADELMRQVRLRNLTGMILIDFINMKQKENYDILIEHMKKLCRMDQVHTNFVDVTGLGIMELTRNKNDKTLKEILQEVENTVDNR